MASAGQHAAGARTYRSGRGRRCRRLQPDRSIDRGQVSGVARADVDRIHQVLSNLTTNALKFTPGGGRVVIEAGPSEDGRAVEFHVTDTGEGLTEDQSQRVFEPFVQVHDAQVHDRVGTGLGLYIARSIVGAHGGRIWVEGGGPGRGSTFTFTLPARLTDGAHHEPAAAEA